MVQLSDEVHTAHSRQERQQLIEELSRLPGNSKVVVSTSESLAFKTDLQLPWNKLRVIRR